MVGKRRISKFIEELLRPHAITASLDEGYSAMASDEEREAEASEWCEALVGDTVNEAR